MSAPDATKYQINYKLSDGTLVNLYAKDVKDLETGLADLGMVASLIKSTGKDLGGPVATANSTADPIATVTQAFPGAQVVQSAPVAAAPAQASQACKHGPMNYREGTNSRGAWRAFMCSAPRGASDKCETIFIR